MPDPQQPAFPPAGAPQPAAQGWTPQPAQPMPGQPYGAQPAAPYGMAPVAPRPAFDFSKVSIFEWLVMGGGLLAFIFSFLPAFKITGFSCSGSMGGGLFTCDDVNTYTSSMFAGVDTSVNAWSLFLAWFGALLVLFAAIVVAAKVFANINQPMLPMIALGLSGIGFILLFIALFVSPTNSTIQAGLAQLNGTGMTLGLNWTREVGFWLMLVCALAALAGAVMMFMGTQKKVPQATYGGYGAPATGYAQPQPGFAQPQQAQFPQQAPQVPPDGQVPPVVPPVA